MASLSAGIIEVEEDCLRGCVRVPEEPGLGWDDVRGQDDEDDKTEHCGLRKVGGC